MCNALGGVQLLLFQDPLLGFPVGPLLLVLPSLLLQLLVLGLQVLLHLLMTTLQLETRGGGGETGAGS